MSRSLAKMLMIASYILLFILILAFAKNQLAQVIVMVAELIAVMILSRFLRCPNCGRSQGKSWLHAEYCPYCGAALEDE